MPLITYIKKLFHAIGQREIYTDMIPPYGEPLSRCAGSKLTHRRKLLKMGFNTYRGPLEQHKSFTLSTERSILRASNI